MFHRDAFLASSGTPTFRLHFTAKKEITDDDDGRPDDQQLQGEMTGPLRAAALAAMACAFARRCRRRRAQTQPPPFDDSAGDAAPAAAAFHAAGRRAAAATRSRSRRTTDAIDDPKVSRRLGTRISVPPPPAGRPPRRARPAPRRPPPPPPPCSPIPSPTEADAGVPTVERPYTPAAEGSFQPTLPRLKLALRRFDFVQIGASESSDGIAAREPFNSLSIDVYPVSRLVRVGLSTAFGWQSGTWLAEGDYFATQSLSLGGQYGGLGRFVPFAEAFAGVGYMRRLQFDRTIPTAFWQFGRRRGRRDLRRAQVGYLSLAIGYLRPVNGFARGSSSRRCSSTPGRSRSASGSEPSNRGGVAVGESATPVRDALRSVVDWRA